VAAAAAAVNAEAEAAAEAVNAAVAVATAVVAAAAQGWRQCRLRQKVLQLALTSLQGRAEMFRSLRHTLVHTVCACPAR
jgi:hypothetical protein